MSEHGPLCEFKDEDDDGGGVGLMGEDGIM